MTDPRETPRNERVAAADLPPEIVGARQRVAGQERQIAQPVVDLLREPGGRRDRQLLFGELVDVYEDREGWSFVQARKDGYVGYLNAEALGEPEEATHVISRPATHVYSEPGFKSRETLSLSHGSCVRVQSVGPEMSETTLGFVPNTHLSPVASRAQDPVTVAELFLGTPYLWGGNSWWGIDCSGLVQAACRACGVACPGDSDQQGERLGKALPAGTEPRRGDLLFWKGHVAWVFEPGVLLHASSYNMETRLESLETVRQRIADQGDGPVYAHRRLDL